MSLLWSTSRTARTREAEFAVMVIESADRAMEASTPRKS
jgi:hypothetical protein